MSIKPLSNEKELLQKIADGDDRAFAELFYWYYKPLGKFVYKMTDSYELTEEVVQDAFVRIWLRKENIGGIDHFGKYIFAICRNETFAVMKKLAVEKAFKTGFEQYLVKEGELDLLENPAEEYRAMISAAVAKLPAQQQKVYIMSRYDRLKYEEIAERLGLSVVTVKKHIQLAVQFIHKDISSKKINPGLILILTTPLILR